jgi:hypothetical protein
MLKTTLVRQLVADIVILILVKSLITAIRLLLEDSL